MIPVQNIYYMLSYAFSALQENAYKDIATEKFDNVAELCTAILIKGVSIQLKKGLHKEYIDKTEPITAPKGKLNISSSIKTMSLLKQQIVCTYDDFTVNSYMNRIIKSTMELLLKSDISKTRKKELRKLLIFFSDVDIISLYSVNWEIPYNRNNKTYRLIISICKLVVKGLLQTTSDGKAKLMEFFDEQRMSHLYEKFILEYYRKEFPQIKADASKINWQLDLDDSRDNLPDMQSDITLSDKKEEKFLIIDAKYYSSNMQVQFGRHTIHSANLYQMFTYVKNKEFELKDKTHKVSGMLLYAHTDEDVQPDNEYVMSGNRISVKTLDLNCDFSEIRKQMNNIANEFIRQIK